MKHGFNGQKSTAADVMICETQIVEDKCHMKLWKLYSHSWLKFDNRNIIISYSEIYKDA